MSFLPKKVEALDSPKFGFKNSSTQLLVMTLGQSLNLLKPQSPHLKVRRSNADFTGLLHGWHRALVLSIVPANR